MKKGEKQKTTVIHRIRKRVHTTVSPETYGYFKETALNAGQLLDTVVSGLRKVTPCNLILIAETQTITNEWTRRDLNPRPLRCERSDLPLIYRPNGLRRYEIRV